MLLKIVLENNFTFSCFIVLLFNWFTFLSDYKLYRLKLHILMMVKLKSLSNWDVFSLSDISGN